MGGDALLHIADRIDAEHERAMADAELAAAPTEAQLEELGYIALPVDADGVPIRPGDALVIFETGEHILAYDIELYDDGRWLVCDDETMDSIHPDRLRHHLAPTVEDVLDEFGRKCWPWNLVSVPFARCLACDRRGDCVKYRVKQQEFKRGWWRR